jgi:hypothetical protein
MNRLRTFGLFPSVDESADRFHRAGWSIGDLLTAGGWLVTGTRGQEEKEGVYGQNQRQQRRLPNFLAKHCPLSDQEFVDHGASGNVTHLFPCYHGPKGRSS